MTSGLFCCIFAQKKPGFITSTKSGRGTTGTAVQKYKNMEYNRLFFEKNFSPERMNKYFALHQTNPHLAVEHYRCNLLLSFGFWVSLLNSEYESLLWHELRRAFPLLPKPLRKRKIVSAPLNRFRRLRNRIYHNEPICWNLSRVEKIHDEILTVTSWMDKDLPSWIRDQERFEDVCQDIRRRMGWCK